jgi:hypothetical protein
MNIFLIYFFKKNSDFYKSEKSKTSEQIIKSKEFLFSTEFF